MLRFFIQPLPGPPSECLVEGDTATLGRSADSDVRLASKFVSRAHARVTRTSEGYRVEDLGSHNGTRVDGEKLTEPVEVAPGAVVHIGCFAITFDEISSSAVLAARSASHSSAVLSSSGIRLASGLH